MRPLPPAPFVELLFGLRHAGVPVSLTEWMTLMEALSKGAVEPSLTDFYRIARSILVKDPAHFDAWDQVFAAVFGDAELPDPLAEELLQWLEDPAPPPALDEETRRAVEELPLDELKQLFEERLQEQTERHDGGNRWIGTGGTSPFGHGGYHPGGIRVGGRGRNRSAAQIASERHFRDYRRDRLIDTRDMAVALKKLRRLDRTEGEPELDVEETIDATSRNAGDLQLIFRPPRRNQAKVLLLLDVGGSMDPWAELVERLFSAASGLGHWRRFEALQFHNCPYETLYESYAEGEGRPTAEVLRELPTDTFLIVVGDASMAPTELTARHGAIDWFHMNEEPGLVWLHRLRSHFRKAVWLNPMPRHWWGGFSVRVIQRLFPMFPLTVEGLEEAVDRLRADKPESVPELDASLVR